MKKVNNKHLFILIVIVFILNTLLFKSINTTFAQFSLPTSKPSEGGGGHIIINPLKEDLDIGGFSIFGDGNIDINGTIKASEWHTSEIMGENNFLSLSSQGLENPQLQLHTAGRWHYIESDDLSYVDNNYIKLDEEGYSGDFVILEDSTATEGRYTQFSNGIRYGPYSTLPVGNYKYLMRLRYEDNTDNSVIATLKLYSAGNPIYDEWNIKGTDFKGSNEWQVFSVPFSIDETTSSFEAYTIPQNNKIIQEDYIAFVPDDDGETQRMHSLSVSSNVGIGVSEPLAKLDVRGNTILGGGNSVNVILASHPRTDEDGNIIGTGLVKGATSFDYDNSVGGFHPDGAFWASPMIYRSTRIPENGSGAFPWNNYGELFIQGTSYGSGYNKGISFVTWDGTEADPAIRMRVNKDGNVGILGENNFLSLSSQGLENPQLQLHTAGRWHYIESDDLSYVDNNYIKLDEEGYSGDFVILEDSTATEGRYTQFSNGIRYGPYSTLPVGNYKYLMRLRYEDNTDNSVIATLKLYSAGNPIYDEWNIKGTDFKGSNEWQVFSVPFSIDETTSSFEAYTIPQNNKIIQEDYIAFVPDDDGETQRMHSLSVSSNVGIGVSEPLAKLDVRGNTILGGGNSVNVILASHPRTDEDGNIIGTGLVKGATSFDYDNSVGGFHPDGAFWASPMIYRSTRIPENGSGAFPWNNYGELFIQGTSYGSGYNKGISFVTWDGTEADPAIRMRIDKVGDVDIKGKIKTEKIYSNSDSGEIAKNETIIKEINFPDGGEVFLLTVKMWRTSVHILKTYLIHTAPGNVNLGFTELLSSSYSAGNIEIENENNSTHFGLNANSDNKLKIIFDNDHDEWQYWNWSYTRINF